MVLRRISIENNFRLEKHSCREGREEREEKQKKCCPQMNANGRKLKTRYIVGWAMPTLQKLTRFFSVLCVLRG
jgi:hypothetical protein